jgi:hypothetical protein
LSPRRILARNGRVRKIERYCIIDSRVYTSGTENTAHPYMYCDKIRIYTLSPWTLKCVLGHVVCRAAAVAVAVVPTERALLLP